MMLSPYWRQTSDVVSGTFLFLLQELWYCDVCGVKHIQSPARCFPVCTQSNAWRCKREQVFIWTTPFCAPSSHRLFNLYVRLQQFFSVYFYFFGSCFIIGNSLAKSFTSLECPIFLFSFALFVLNLAAKFPFPSVGNQNLWFPVGGSIMWTIACRISMLENNLRPSDAPKRIQKASSVQTVLRHKTRNRASLWLTPSQPQHAVNQNRPHHSANTLHINWHSENLDATPVERR